MKAKVSSSKDKNIIYSKYIDTPLGKMIACSSKQGICLLDFIDRNILEKELKAISKYFDAEISENRNQYLEDLDNQLQEYFQGNRTIFSVPLDIVGTEFQNKVWEVLNLIPFGETKSYKEQALIMNKPKSVRAVANANGMNKISILIPCHRVIGSNGSLTGYGGGLWRKEYLLNLERKAGN